MPRFLARLLPLLLFSAALYADSSPLNLHWADLPRAITGKSVTVNLKDGSSVKADVTSVEPTALAVVVAKKGRMSIPRETIASVSFVGLHKRGRILGTTLGVVGGLAAGGLVALASSDISFFGPSHPNHAGQAAGVALMVGIPIAGYYIGKSFDRELVRITILPD
jgi:hypothetical protein